MLLVDQGNLCYEFALVADPEVMCVNFGFDASGDFDPPSVAIANTCFEIFEATFLEQMNQDYNLIGCVMQVMSVGGIIEARSTNAPSNGANAEESLVQNTAILVHKNTLDAGRGKNGRCYIPGVVETDVANNGTLYGGAVTDWQAQATEFFEAFDGVAAPTLVVNHGDIGDSRPGIIIGLTIDPSVATQRRRLRR